jgi:hypothetical protein
VDRAKGKGSQRNCRASRWTLRRSLVQRSEKWEQFDLEVPSVKSSASGFQCSPATIRTVRLLEEVQHGLVVDESVPRGLMTRIRWIGNRRLSPSHLGYILDGETGRSPGGPP